jgi:hypothetical protein
MHASPTLIGHRQQAETQPSRPIPGISDRAHQEAELRLVGRAKPASKPGEPRAAAGAPSALRTDRPRTAGGW